MTLFTRRAIILAVLMLGVSMLSVALTPTKRTTIEAAQFDLESLIPHQFGDWQMDERTELAVVNPQAQETLDRLYSQVLSRTYINRDGRRIMLSLAYGEESLTYSKDQSLDKRIHRPEICYPAQGFQIIDKWKDAVSLDSETLPVMRITTQFRDRYEPLTYWIRVGDTIVRGQIEQTFARMSYGLTGIIPDGILFRVSEINRDFQDSFALQDQFIRALLSSLTPTGQKFLIGTLILKEAEN
jgi:EpsI family protein